MYRHIRRVTRARAHLASCSPAGGCFGSIAGPAIGSAHSLAIATALSAPATALSALARSTSHDYLCAPARDTAGIAPGADRTGRRRICGCEGWNSGGERRKMVPRAASRRAQALDSTTCVAVRRSPARRGTTRPERRRSIATTAAVAAPARKATPRPPTVRPTSAASGVTLTRSATRSVRPRLCADTVARVRALGSA